MPSRFHVGTAAPTRTLGIRLLASAGLGALVWLGARGAGPIPPLGPLLDPVRGAWALAASAGLPAQAEARIRGLSADTRVLYDDRAVPHIFAASETDAWRALGYVTARDRLFQLDLQARAGGGTLTELLGAQALRTDRSTPRARHGTRGRADRRGRDGRRAAVARGLRRRGERLPRWDARRGTCRSNTACSAAGRHAGARSVRCR